MNLLRNLVHHWLLRFYFDPSTGTGRIKMHMASSARERAGSDLVMSLVQELQSALFNAHRHSMFRTGATTRANDIGKEGDAVIIPSSRGSHPTVAPSVILEVGLSQSLPSLQEDAREWLALASNKACHHHQALPLGYSKRMFFEFWDRNAAGAARTCPALPSFTWRTVQDATNLSYPAHYFYDNPISAFLGNPVMVVLPQAYVEHWFRA
ncbi:hypothetical protein DFH09DRAFT_9632 [Mycena vulgaris]|nr:hypothetical protein DFH09DRAFT_9632 [Mycena vulgaris]